MDENKPNIGFPLLRLFALLLLGIVLSSLIQHNITGVQSQEDSVNLKPGIYLISLGIFQILTFLLPALIWLKHIDLKVHLFDPTKTSLIRTLKAALLFIAVYVVANIINSITENILIKYYPDLYQNLVEQATLYTNLFQHKHLLWLSIIVVGVIPAVCEEFFFRAGVFGYLEQKTGSFWHSAILSSIFFAGVHFQFTQFLPIFILGMMLAAAYHYTRSIWVPIALHMINNTVQIIIIYKGADWL